MRISVIIPCWNDAAQLQKLLPQLRSISGIHEIIVADASSDERAAEVAQSFEVKIARSALPNRGAQMNAGARMATGDVLLFQHADTEFTQAHVDSMCAALRDEKIVGGAFHRQFDERHAFLKHFEFVGRLLSRAGGTLYGDQSIFVRRDEFEKLGGYAEIPLMEDVDFSRRLRKIGGVAVIDPPIYSSPRRHQIHGAWKMSLLNGLMIFLYRVGVSPQRLHSWYYRHSPVAPAR